MFFDSLEPRRLMSFSTTGASEGSGANRTLVIKGTSSADTAELSVAGGGFRLNGTAVKVNGVNATVAAFKKIRVQAAGGNDKFTTAASVPATVSITFNGEGGNDTFVGGAGKDVANGGEGNDKLYGGSGSDKLNGNVGKDFLAGGNDPSTPVVFQSNDNTTIKKARRELAHMNSADGSALGSSRDELSGGSGDDTALIGDSDMINLGGNSGDLLLIQGSRYQDRFFVENAGGGAIKASIFVKTPAYSFARSFASELVNPPTSPNLQIDGKGELDIAYIDADGTGNPTRRFANLEPLTNLAVSMGSKQRVPISVFSGTHLNVEQLYVLAS